MSQIEVHRLRYRGSPVQAGRVGFAIEDALRTEVPDDGRLILVRSLRLGRIGLRGRGAAPATASAWRDTLSAARHGANSGAATANCVWFNDVAEARAMLLRELARGRAPTAWFWILVVPDWRGMTFERYLEHRVAQAFAASGDEAIGELAGEASAAGCMEALAAALLKVAPSLALTEPATGAGRSPPAARAREGEHREELRAAGAPNPPQQAVADAVVNALPPALRAVLQRLAARSDTAILVETLVRGFALRVHPALALAPGRLADAVGAVVQVLQFGPAGGVKAAAAMPLAMETADRRKSGGAHRDTARVGLSPNPMARDAQGRPERNAEQRRSAEPREGARLVAEPEAAELASQAAGLFLAIVPLARLGWRDWLAARPDLLFHQPGARLFRAIARRYRVDPLDPVLGQFPDFDRDGDPPPSAVTEAIGLWQSGLDGWLRRKAHLTLAGLVLRRGWVLPGAETTIVRFPLGAIDMRLRRLALDLDPGWVDWLGHSYRLVYRDRPLIGPQGA